MLQTQPVAAADAFATATAVVAAADDNGDNITARRLTVVANDGEDHRDIEGAVGGEVVDPFWISVAQRSALHEVNITDLSTLLKTA